MSLATRKLPWTQLTAAFKQEWSDLLQSARADLSLAPEWFASTVHARSADNCAYVFAIYDGNRLIGVLPHVDRRNHVLGIPVSTAESPGSYLVANHPGLIAGDAQVVLGAILDHSNSCDVLVLPNLPIDSATLAAVYQLAGTRGLIAVSRPGHSSPYLSIATSWDEFIASKDKKLRYKVRNSLKDLEAAGTVREEWITSATQCDRFYADMLQIESHSWKVAAGMAISGSELEQAYYRRLLPFLAQRDALRANAIYLDENPVAYSLCYLSQGAFRQLKTSFDDRHAKLSPGSAVLHRALQRAFEAGGCEFDFLGDMMQHKNHWASGVREHRTVYLFLRSWRGRLAGRLRQFTDRLRVSGSGADQSAMAPQPDVSAR